MRLWIMIVMLLASPAATTPAGAAGIPGAPECPNASPASPALAGPLRIRFLGVSTVLFDDGRDQILIDAFFSRHGFVRQTLGRIGSEPDQFRFATTGAGISKDTLRAILITHTHHDHTLDAATLAAWAPGADMIGSGSLMTMLSNRNLGTRLKRAADETGPWDGTVFCYGAFRITAILTPHSTPHLSKGEIDKPIPDRARAFRYHSGQGFSYLIEHPDLRVLVYPSAAYEATLLKRYRADVVFLGVFGLGRKDEAFTAAYWSAVVEATQAKLVIPIHWDNFGRRLDAGGSKPELKPMPWPIDDSPKARKRIEKAAASHRAPLRWPTLFADINAAGLVD